MISTNTIVAAITVVLLGNELTTKAQAQVSWIPDSTFVLPGSEKSAIISLTNHLRSTINPAPNGLNVIHYNETVEADVINFLNARDSNWVFENDTNYNNYIAASPNPMNGYSMFDRPELAKWKPYCKFWVHDTMSPHTVTRNGQKSAGPSVVTNIFKFRLNQLRCFVWSSCEKYNVPGFLSCLEPQSQSTNGGACGYADKFLLRMLLNFDSAFVVGINHKGPFTPKPQVQSLSFWGWACASNGIKDIPETGYPYASGNGRASECDAQHPRVINGLCDKPLTGRALRPAAV